MPRWLQVRPLHAGGHPLIALAFVVDRTHPQYAGRLPTTRQAKVIATAEGVFGSSADYLERARVALVTHGVVDPYLERLSALVARRRGTRRSKESIDSGVAEAGG
jgi:cation transport protein ChaC